MLIDERQKLFPAEFFSTRIEAVHQYLDEARRKVHDPAGLCLAMCQVHQYYMYIYIYIYAYYIYRYLIFNTYLSSLI